MIALTIAEESSHSASSSICTEWDSVHLELHSITQHPNSCPENRHQVFYPAKACRLCPVPAGTGGANSPVALAGHRAGGAPAGARARPIPIPEGTGKVFDSSERLLSTGYYYVDRQ